MLNRSTKDLRELRLRSNPAYELVLFDRLSLPERETLEALGRDPDGYGVLRPRDASVSVKSISRDMALLWFTLQSPGLLPQYAIQSMGKQCDQMIGQMILDDILAVEAGGEFISGPAASELVCVEASGGNPDASLTALSRRALEYAEALEINEPNALSARLYTYNHVPATSSWRGLLPDAAAVEQYLGVESGATERMLGRGWTRVPDKARRWIAWQSPQKQRDGLRMTYKLYVSPACSELRAGFHGAAEAAATSKAFHMKVGSDVHGQLRPDKIVMYFEDFDDLQETATRIRQSLEHCPPHGVPFTAEIGGNGLLSWGIDPPTVQHSVPWLERESWRQRISNRLATALIQARASGRTGFSTIRFAMDRLGLEGIDTSTWTPTEELAWTEPSGACAEINL